MRIMKISKGQLKKAGKRAAATAAGLLAAATLALGAVVDSPEELFPASLQAAQIVICASVQDECAPDDPAATPAKKERLRDKLRRLFLSQPSVVCGIVLLPFWAIGKALLTLLSLFFTALNPLLQIVLGILFNALLLFGLFIVVLKLLFPNLRLWDFFTKKNILLLTAGSLLLSITDKILKAFWDDYRAISIAIKLGVALIVMSLLCWRMFGSRVPQKATNSA